MKNPHITGFFPHPLYVKTKSVSVALSAAFMPQQTEGFGERVERDASVSWIFISSVDMRDTKQNFGPRCWNRSDKIAQKLQKCDGAYRSDENIQFLTGLQDYRTRRSCSCSIPSP